MIHKNNLWNKEFEEDLKYIVNNCRSDLKKFQINPYYLLALVLSLCLSFCIVNIFLTKKANKGMPSW